MSETTYTDQQALEAIASSARSEQDLNDLRQWQEEIDDKASITYRSLGQAPVSHLVEIDGVVVESSIVEAERQSGHEVSSNAYGPSGRQA